MQGPGGSEPCGQVRNGLRNKNSPTVPYYSTVLQPYSYSCDLTFHACVRAHQSSHESAYIKVQYAERSREPVRPRLSRGPRTETTHELIEESSP